MRSARRLSWTVIPLKPSLTSARSRTSRSCDFPRLPACQHKAVYGCSLGGDQFGDVFRILANAEQGARLQRVHPVQSENIETPARRAAAFLDRRSLGIEDRNFDPV